MIIQRSPDRLLRRRLRAALALAVACSLPYQPAFSNPAITAGAENLFRDTGATALVVITVRGRDVRMQTFGETSPGSLCLPDSRSLIRLCSITKLFTADILGRMVADHEVRLEDPLQHFAPRGVRIPTTAIRGRVGQPITLLELATHTAGIAREVGPEPANAAPFTFPTFTGRWKWLQRQKLLSPPGSAALYSNVGFDLLADALQSSTGIPYPKLLSQRLLDPLGMKSTTFQPTAEECAHLLRSLRNDGPCTDTIATDGSAGLYSTPADMARWLRYLVGDSSVNLQKESVSQEIYFIPSQLRSTRGLNHAGRPSGIGLGWLRLGTPNGRSIIMEKTGAGGGFITYVAVNFAEHTAIFFAFTAGNREWRSNPFSAANHLLLGMSGLPPIGGVAEW